MKFLLIHEEMILKIFYQPCINPINPITSREPLKNFSPETAQFFFYLKNFDSADLFALDAKSLQFTFSLPNFCGQFDRFVFNGEKLLKRIQLTGFLYT